METKKYRKVRTTYKRFRWKLPNVHRVVTLRRERELGIVGEERRGTQDDDDMVTGRVEVDSVDETLR